MQPRKTNTYEVFPPSPATAAKEPPRRPAREARDPDPLDPAGLPEQDRNLLSSCWELATQYRDRGRAGEAVEFFLVAAALFERSGQVPRRIYELVLELDPDNALAASRLDSDEVAGSRAALFIQHVLSRHDPGHVQKVLQDERQRNWVTPPRGAQQTCPDCGMGIPNGQDHCTFCGASLATLYRKRATAAYTIPGKSKTLPRGLPVAPRAPGAVTQQQDATARDSGAPQPAPSPAQHSDDPLVPDTEPRGLVRLLDLEGGLLTEGLVGPDGCLVGSAQGSLGQGLEQVPRDLLHLAFADNGFTYQVTTDVALYQVVQGTTPLDDSQLVQAGSHVFRFTGGDGRLKVEVFSQDGTALATCRFAHATVTIGKTENDLDLPNDAYLADHHLQITMDESGRLTLTDMDTDSGTFVTLARQGTLPPDRVVRIRDIFVVLTLPS